MIQFVGAHTGCGCGFPHVVADSVIEYQADMWPDDRVADLRSVAALIGLLRTTVDAGQPVELYPVWAGDEDNAPKGVIEWSPERLDAGTLFFHEQFMHVVRRAAAPPTGAEEARR